MNYFKYEEIAKEIRQHVIKAIYHGKSGHPGGSLSATDILTALFFKEMNIDPENPHKEDRDLFVLSKGHAAPSLYATMGVRGFYPVEEIYSLRQLGSKFQGHPSSHKLPILEHSTGSLGQGFSAAVGMALGSRLNDKGQRVYTILGDGELQEGLVWEAAMAAGHYKLDNMCAFVDWNGLQIDGANDDVMTVKPIDEKFKAFGWNVYSINGHKFEEIFKALDDACDFKGKPTVIIAKTHKGQGVSFMADQAGWHGKAPTEEQAIEAIKELGGQW
ncbi:transketolase [Eubacteriales bacterium KG127]